ncbi:MAG: ABC transporter permease, partial [Clostridia bacterium]|nr:ABC transporter permease [Clostridia bacterium]
MSPLISLIQAAIYFGTVIMFGSLGETLTEKSGNLNLGVPGIMYLGAIASLTGAFFYERAVETPNRIICILIAFLCAFIASALGGLIFSFLTITLRANQNVTGLALTIFGSGIGNFFGGSLNKLAGGVGQISVSATSAAYRQNIPALAGLGPVGDLLFSYGFLVYLAIILAIALQWFLRRTRTGLNLRAIGENPGTADAAGINVTRYKYLSTCLGAGIVGLGGLYYVRDYTKGTWANDGTIEGLGWLAVALVIFTTWKPINAIWGAYLFGVLYWMNYYIPGLTR